jgi:hypothetical protein
MVIHHYYKAQQTQENMTKEVKMDIDAWIEIEIERIRLGE